MLAVLIALKILGYQFQGRKARCAKLIATGLVAGLAIVGMHYVGDAGISNYKVRNSPGSMAGAWLIACAGMTVIVLLHCILQNILLGTLLMRFVLALLMATSVTGMHSAASLGATYMFKQANSAQSTVNVNAAIGLFFSCSALITGLAIIFVVREQQRAILNKAHQVVLMCAWFDKQGKVMVHQDGHLPCEKITNDDNKDSFADDFDVGHAAFQWIFKVSHNWFSIYRWISNIHAHLQALGNANGVSAHGPMDNSFEYSNMRDGRYSIIFRENFCAAAANMAKRLEINLPTLGRLYEGVMTSKKSRQPFLHHAKNHSAFRSVLKLFGRSSRLSSSPDVEAASDTFPRGQVLFVTKIVTDTEVAAMTRDARFRFLPVSKVAKTIALAMHVPEDSAIKWLDAIKQSVLSSDIQCMEGLHLGIEVLRPHPNGHFDILACKKGGYRLPSVYLCSEERYSQFQKFLVEYDGLPIESIVTILNEEHDNPDQALSSFKTVFRLGIDSLTRMFDSPAESIHKAQLCSRRVRVWDRNCDGDTQQVHMIAFTLMGDIHNRVKVYGEEVEYVSCEFFRCYQQMRIDPKDRGFHIKVDKEFMARFQDLNTPPSSSTLARFSTSSRTRLLGTGGGSSASVSISSSSGSVYELEETSLAETRTGADELFEVAVSNYQQQRN